MSYDINLPTFQRNPPALFSGQNVDSCLRHKYSWVYLPRIMALTFPVISHGEVIGPVTDVFLLKTPWYVVQLWLEDKLIILSEVKVSAVGLTGA